MDAVDFEDITGAAKETLMRISTVIKPGFLHTNYSDEMFTVRSYIKGMVNHKWAFRCRVKAPAGVRS